MNGAVRIGAAGRWAAQRIAMALSAGAMIAASLAGASHAQTSLPPVPSVRIFTGPLVDPATAATYYGGLTTSTNGLCRDYPTITQVCPSTPTPPPEVVELARALQHDPNLIYEYVRNSVDTEFQFGLQKGALGVVIDGSGTPFDQAELMVELLQLSGISASYDFGTITLTGAQFQTWTGITDAQAACNFLAVGGIPAVINSDASKPVTCTPYAGATVSSITMSHVWVQAKIGPATYFFDPSYKSFNHKPGLGIGGLKTAMGLIAGQTLTTATTGMASGQNAGANYVSSLDQTDLDGKLLGYAKGLLTRMGQADLQGADMTDVVGGRILLPATRPSAGWQQTSLPYVNAGWKNWAAIPDQFRTTLTVSSAGTFTPATFFVDEIYGRKLQVLTQWNAQPPHTQNSPFTLEPVLAWDGIPLQVDPNINSSPGVQIDLTLTAVHPFAAGNGAYGQTPPVVKTVDTTLPITIIHGWGHTSSRLEAMWRREQGLDGIIPRTAIPGTGGIQPTDANLPPATAGDLLKARVAASWLTQFSRSSELNAEIANSRFTHLQSLGVSSGVFRAAFPPPVENTSGPSIVPGTPYGPSGYTLTDEVTVIDVESDFGLTSRVSSAPTRRAALHVIAASAAALEGSVIEQLTDNPDSVSAARRLTWGNAPEAGETPDTRSRLVYDFNSSNVASAPALVTFENGFTGPFVITSGSQSETQMAVPSNISDGFKTSLSGAITNYVNQGFDVVASNEALLGPGSREGGEYPYQVITNGFQSTVLYTRAASLQNGGAFIANHYDANGDPDQIAHVVMRLGEVTKGGGGPSIDETSQFNASNAADALKDRFVDRSTELGVNLSSGSAGFTSPVLNSAGQGESPYNLSVTVSMRGGSLPVIYGKLAGELNSPTRTGPITNWEGSAETSSSGLEAMGASRVEPAAFAVAAFVAMQDIWSAAPSPQRELTGAMTADWWTRQIGMNDITIMQGASASPMLATPSGAYISAGGGADHLVVAGGARQIVRPVLLPPPNEAYPAGSSQRIQTTRRWIYQPVQLTQVGAHGDARTYQYWSTPGPDGNSLFQGFDLASWTWPQGVFVTLAYASQVAHEPSSVTSSLGRTLTLPLLPNSGCLMAQMAIASDSSDGFDTDLYAVGPTAPADLSLTDQDQGVTRATFNPWTAGGSGARPMAECTVSQVFEPVNTSIASLAYTYDSLGRVNGASDANKLQLGTGAAWQFFVAEGYRGSWKDPLGGAYAVETYQDGRETHTIDELGRVVDTVLDGRHRVLSRTFPAGDQEQFGYDASDNVTSLTRVASPAEPAASTKVTAVYDPTWNKPTSVIDAIGNAAGGTPSAHETDLAYYPAGVAGASLVQEVQRPAQTAGGTRPTYSYQYSLIGLLTRETDPTGIATAHDYDGLGNMTDTKLGAQTASPLVTTFQVDGLGDVTATIDPLGNAVTAQYDAMRRKTDEEGLSGGVGALPLTRSHFVYDANGRLTQEQHALALDASGAATSYATTQTAYSPTGKKLQVIDPVGDITQYAYDADDRLQCTTVRMNPSATIQATEVGTSGNFQLPVSACAQSQTPAGPNGFDRITRNNFDAAGEVTSIERAVGDVALHQTYETFTYTPDGKQASIADAVGNTTGYAYDGFDRLIRTNFPLGSAPPAAPDPNDFEAYGYDANDNHTQLTKRDGTQLSFGYDALNEQVSKSVPAKGSAPAYQVTTAYDLAGRKLSATFTTGPSQGQAVAYAYDGYGRRSSETTNGRKLTYGYDTGSNRVSVTWPDAFVATYAYDPLHRVTKITDPTPTLLARFTYDTLGRRTQTARGNGATTTYGYDDASRMNGLAHSFPGTAADNQAYAYGYNPAGQMVSQEAPTGPFVWSRFAAGSTAKAYDGLNRDATVAAIGTALPCGGSGGYDCNGNLTNNGASVFAYDQENRLVSVTQGGASVDALSYDALGRLAQTVGASGVATQFLYDDDELVAEYSGATLEHRYVHGPGVNEPIAWYDVSSGSPVLNWLHADRQGSIIAASQTGGFVPAAQIYAYGPYGEPQSWGGSRFAYTGQIQLPEVALYHYKARAYDPGTGRFMQTDPIGYKSDVDLYAYAGEDPLNRLDPQGTDTCPGSKRGECVRADENRHDYDPEKSSHQTTQNTPEMDRAMHDNVSQVRVAEGGSKEKMGFIVKSAQGGLEFQAPKGGHAGSYGVIGDYASAPIPPGAVAVIHGHISSSDGSLVSVTGLGDAAPLQKNLTNGTNEGARLGVWEIKDGRVQFRMIDGKMNTSRTGEFDSEVNQMQDRVNQAQRYFYAK